MENVKISGLKRFATISHTQQQSARWRDGSTGNIIRIVIKRETILTMDYCEYQIMHCCDNSMVHKTL